MFDIQYLYRCNQTTKVLITQNIGRMKKQVNAERAQYLKSLVRKVTNAYIKLAHTKTLVKLLVEFNYHYKSEVERTREELVGLVKRERNKVLWGNVVVA